MGEPPGNATSPSSQLRDDAQRLLKDPKQLERACAPFANPTPHLKVWLQKGLLAPHELTDGVDRLGVTITLGIGEEAVRAHLREAPASWWGLSTLAQVLEWAGECHLAIQKDVAERLLLAAASRYPGMRDIRDALSSPKGNLQMTRQWVVKALRRPDDVNGQWNGVDPRARSFMEKMLLLDVFEKILEEFRRRGDEDRADFWIEYVNQLRDAVVVMARDVAVCVLSFGEVVAIEFGTIGNAAYVYAAPPDIPALERLATRRDMAAQDFKASELRPWRGGPALELLFRIIHNHGWQYTAKRQLARVGVHI